MYENKKYKIVDKSFDIVLDGEYSFEELKQYFKYEVMEGDDKELVIYHNEEIDDCENTYELSDTLDMLIGMKYEFIII